MLSATESATCSLLMTPMMSFVRGILPSPCTTTAIVDFRRHIRPITANMTSWLRAIVTSRLATQPNSPWWDDTTTPGVNETRDQIMSSALDQAAGDLRHELGDPANWTWGRIHTVTFQEQTLGTSGIGPLEAILNSGPYPAPGTCTVVDKICGSISDEWPQGDAPANLQHLFAASSAPSYRLAIDMSNLDAARIVTTTGQSGNPFDRHYGDLIDLWATGRTIPLPFSSADISKAAAAAAQAFDLPRPAAPYMAPMPGRLWLRLTKWSMTRLR